MTGYQLDTSRIRRGFDRAAPHYDGHSELQRIVRDELLGRLDLVAIEPTLVVDAGSGTGGALEALRERYPRAHLVACDTSAAMLGRIRQSDTQALQADLRALPLADASVGLLFSNFVLPWCDDLDGALRELRRVMGASSLLSFTTLGPDTLSELRRAWRSVDAHEHVHGFIDMHDIGDALVRAGFADPVLDVERYTLTYPDLRGLLAELRYMGSLNALPGRRRGLLGADAFARLCKAYTRDDQGRFPANFEVVYGHAWCPGGPPPVRAADGLASIPVNSVGRRRRGP